MDYSISRETYRRTSSGITVVAHFFGIIAIVLLLVWLLHYRGGLDINSYDNADRIFNVHPFLMFFGFIFLSGQAMMSYKTVRAEHNVQRFIHMFLNLSAIVLGIVGIHAAFKFHDRVGLDDMYTLHSWIGITTLCLFILQWLFGFSLFMFPRGSAVTRTRLMPIHVNWGRALFYMAIITAETGLMQKFTILGIIKNRENYLINFLALAILIFGIAVDLSIALAHHV